MARKKKKLKEKSSFFSKKKLRRLVKRVALVGLGLTAGVLYRPSIIKDPAKRAQVEDVREQILSVNEDAQEKALDVIEGKSEAVKTTIENTNNFVEQVTHQNPEEVITNTVTVLKEEVETIPENQVKKIKYEFCKDIIEELSCEAE